MIFVKKYGDYKQQSVYIGNKGSVVDDCDDNRVDCKEERHSNQMFEEVLGERHSSFLILSFDLGIGES